MTNNELKTPIFLPLINFHKYYPILEQNSLISIPYPRLNCSETLTFTVAHTYIPIMAVPHLLGGRNPGREYEAALCRQQKLHAQYSCMCFYSA